MPSIRLLIVASSAFALTAIASAPTVTRALRAASSGDEATSTTYRLYGGSAEVGNGHARAYVLVDRATNEPTEIGVALDERALDGLPTAGAGHHGVSGPVHQWLLDLPAERTTPFRFVELNWNPNGHEPDGVYRDVPHFDFHFYTISRAERDSITPENPRYVERANAVPTGDYVPPFTVQLGPPGATPADVAVPLMGVHWVDVRSPELQALLGKPEAYKPFTATFIVGSWNGIFHFWEPMVTRAHMLEKRTTTDPAVRDQVIPIPVPARYHVPGHYPTAYRVTWDEQAREYRVALTRLARRD